MALYQQINYTLNKQLYIRRGCTQNSIERAIMKYTVHCNVIEMKLIYICIYKQKAPVDFLHFDFLV